MNQILALDKELICNIENIFIIIIIYLKIEQISALSYQQKVDMSLNKFFHWPNE